MSTEKFLVVIGPSGAGKSSIIKSLRDKGLVRPVPSWTTRPPRSEEIENDIDHVYVSNEEFDTKVKEGFFLEVVNMFGLPYKYGLPPINLTQASNEVPILMLRASLIPLLKKHYDNYVIYQIEDSYERIIARLKDREKNGERLGERPLEHEKEIGTGRAMADRVFINDKSILDVANQIEHAILKDFKGVRT